MAVIKCPQDLAGKLAHARKYGTTRDVKSFKVRVLVVPTTLETLTTGAQPRHEERTIWGTDKADAMRRAGIQ